MKGQTDQPILIVEDDAKIRKLLVMMLAAAGHSCVTVGGVGEALAQLSRRSFGLILMDLLMPPQDGLELLRALRESRGTTPVLVVTGSGDPELLDAARDRGALEILQKPFTLEELHQKVERCLSHEPEARQATRPSACLDPGEAESLLDTTHALKNLLAIALAQAEYLLFGGEEDPETRREALESIRKVALESRELIRQLERRAQTRAGESEVTSCSPS